MSERRERRREGEEEGEKEEGVRGRREREGGRELGGR